MRNLDSGQTIVIGAGLAGLTAAHQLAKAGHQVVVLEAEDRVGGRAYSSRDWSGGQHTDYGGELIDPDYKALIALCEDLGVELTEPQVYAEPHEDDLTLVEGYLRVGTFVLDGVVLSREECLDAATKIRAAAEAHPGVRHEIVEQWVRRARLEPREAGLVRCVAKMLTQLDASDCDVHYVFGQASGRFMRIAGGTQTLAEKLAEGLDIRFGENVRLVRRIRGVTVSTESGNVYEGSRVICATSPFGMLQIGFDPPMQEEKNEAVLSMLPAMGGKAIAQYAEGDAVRAAFAQVVYTDGDFNAAWVTQPDASGPAIVTSFVSGIQRHLLADEGAVLDALDALVAQVVGGPVTRLRGETKNWWADPLQLCVTVNPPELSRPRITGSLAAMERRTHMAGDFTDAGMAGTLEGAVRSGLRAAEEIVRTPQRFHIDDINERLARA